MARRGRRRHSAPLSSEQIIWTKGFERCYTPTYLGERVEQFLEQIGISGVQNVIRDGSEHQAHFRDGRGH